ncbi:MAG: two-component system, OmpR family, sensor histidine kinase KdpD [Actinomycetota bacterium]|jgi:two-component system sensor histidine kinase TctE|nr:two-component system, OmpR family, sensor histidine kinase KdpD [Actinomycetota bacterium]
MVALIDAQAQQIEALQHAVEVLEGRLALRTELDVIVAHEVRTPLTVITGALDTLADLEITDDRIRHLVEMAHTQADHLAGVVDELLTPQSTGDPVVDRARLSRVAIERVVTRALAAVSTRLRGRTVETSVPADVLVTTSTPRLTAVLVNLLENAARYGGDGPIECSTAIVDGMLVLEVSDRGPGLGDLDPEQLFSPFIQGSEADPDGRGVGLYLVRMLARSMGGDVSLGNREGGGCVARVELPQRRNEDTYVPSSPGHLTTAP